MCVTCVMAMLVMTCHCGTVCFSLVERFVCEHVEISREHVE